MALRIVFTRRADKEFNELAELERRRIEERLTAYAAEPDHPRHDVRPVLGTGNGYRLRSGNWRVLFVLEQDTIWVQRVPHRREAYR